MLLDLTDVEFNELTNFVKVNYGLDLTAKRTFVEMRVQRLMAEKHYTNFTDYFKYVCGDLSGIAISNFISNLTVNYTQFNREPFHFEYLAEHILPELYDRLSAVKDFRIWSSGCSTGEEPYTLAMTLCHFLGIHKPAWDMQILATDISTYALKKAIAGSYPIESLHNLPPEFIRRYFLADPENQENMIVGPEIKNEVVFRKHNMVKDPFRFKQKFHVIFCRNVMIYFDEETKNRLINRFYDHMDEGGYLFIGLSETIDLSATRFQYVAPSIYRKGGMDA